jgi:hypothetical protein
VLRIGSEASVVRISVKWKTVGMQANSVRPAALRDAASELLRRLTERGYRRIFAGITQPNAASNEFHRVFGFRHAGLYERVGWKLDSWHDVEWMQLDLPAGELDRGPTPIV